MSKKHKIEVVDLKVSNHGSIYLLEPITDAGKSWIHDNILDDALTFGNAIAVEPRYIGAIMDGASADGLEVR